MATTAKSSVRPDTSPFTLTEEGAALERLTGTRERFDVVVIGAGQAGLAAGYHLSRAGVSFVILDGDARVGDTWRRRWDSLRLFTPAQYDSLAGMSFPAPATSFPTKDEMAAYLEAYADRFALPIRNSVRVERITRDGERYLIDAGFLRFEAAHVIVATSSFRVPVVPPFALELDPRIKQVHSSEYSRPSALADGDVLIVGAGNSGAEISAELARHGKKTLLAGRDVGEVPFRIDGFLGRFVLVHLVLRFVFHYVLTVKTPMGRRVRQNAAGHGGALIRIKGKDLVRAGVRRVPRLIGVKAGKPIVEGGEVLDVANVVWCTGFSRGFSFVDLPVFGADGAPLHDAGVARGEPGLYFLGLPFLYSMSSVMVHGVSRDAARVVRTISGRVSGASRERHAS